MIVKMNFINISGPRDDIDRVTERYLSKYEIQLESALSELKTEDNLRPFSEANPYKDALDKATHFVDYLEISDDTQPYKFQDTKEIFGLIDTINDQYTTQQDKIRVIHDEILELQKKRQIIAPFRPLDGKLSDVLQYEFINFRFGRIATEFYKKMESYVYKELNAIFVEGDKDENYIYGAYFVSPGESQKIDAVFQSLHFEKIEMPEDFQLTPAEEYTRLSREISTKESQIDALKAEILELLTSKKEQVISAKNRLDELAANFDVRKMAARIEDKRGDYYMLCGWIPEEQLTAFLDEAKNDPDIFVIVEDERTSCFGEPPTKLKNPKLFKPFEMFIQMYGLPAHDEFDPTIFVGLTYSFIFGVMFGDVGQGLLLLIGGALIYHFKKAALAGIIATAGIFSTIFGFMFGSVFGFEDILDPLWLRPINAMTDLPFVGKLNTVFIVAIAFGMGLILIAMLLHIWNAVKSHETGNIWFDANGVAGFVFYAAAVATITLFMTGHKTPGAIVFIVMFGLPLLLILFKEPLTKKIEKSADAMEESAGMFLVQGLFELFETLLSYFSNTLSFVRIGAFAVSHAAIMEVVLILAGVESGTTNWLVIVLGNLFVCGFEGLIVGIQVLRLEYYEMFSRFYKGSGREFKPYMEPHKKSVH